MTMTSPLVRAFAQGEWALLERASFLCSAAGSPPTAAGGVPQPWAGAARAASACGTVCVRGAPAIAGLPATWCFFSYSTASSVPSQQQLPTRAGGTEIRPAGDADDLMRTRVVLGVLRSAEEPLTREELFRRLQQQHPEAGVRSTHHLKKLIAELKRNKWVKPRPLLNTHGSWRFTVTPLGACVTLNDQGSAGRQLRLAQQKAEEIMRAAGGMHDGGVEAAKSS